MHHRFIVHVFLVGLALGGRDASAAPGFLCFEQHKTGFAVGKWSNEWEIAKFANLKRFVLRRPTVTEADADPQRIWMLAEEGKDFAFAECRQDFSSAGVLACTGSLQVLINRETGRFQAFQQAGYAAGPAGERVTDGSLTPYLSIGRCEATEVK